MLAEELPDDSAFVAYLAGGREYRGWTFDRHLLAGIFDAVQVNTVTTAQVASKKKIKSPKPVPRPGGKPRRSDGVSITALMPRRRAPGP